MGTLTLRNELPFTVFVPGTGVILQGEEAKFPFAFGPPTVFRMTEDEVLE